jgi:transcriptional regulator with XRE-family HTH domain
MLADAVGVSFQQVQKYEEGTDRITAGALISAGDKARSTGAILFEGLSGRRE